MPNVDDLLETLHGPISDQLRQREGKRLAKSHKYEPLDVHDSGNPSIPSGTKKGEAGTAGGPDLTPDKVGTEYEKKEIEAAHRVARGGSAIPELDEEK
jgi:hypothetical protein